MTYTKLLFGDGARAKILIGAKALADAVRPTLRPKSKGILMGKKWGTPSVCDDGVTIAREVRMKDPIEDLGVQMLRQAAVKTGDAVGDGTTTSTLLAYALFAEGVRNVVAGASATDLKRGFDIGARVAVEALKKSARPVEGRAEKAQIAAVRAIEGDHTSDVLTGIRALQRAMEMPLRQIATNAQIDAGVAVERVSGGQGAFGLDASKGSYEDLIKLGIIDPVKVVRTALESAVSIAGTLLLAEGTLTEVEEHMPAHTALPEPVE